MKNGDQIERARRLSWFGLSKNKSRLENDITEVGYKYAMNNVNATIGSVQMKYLGSNIEKYIDNGKFFDNQLDNIAGIELCKYNKNTSPSYWLYTMKVDNRDSFCKMMESRGIMASKLHHRSDTHSIFAESKRELPSMDEWDSKYVHIPCGWWVTEDDRNYIVEAIKKGW